MYIIYYPNNTVIANNAGPVCKFLKDLARKKPSLWNLVDARIKEIKKEINLKHLENQKIVEKLNGLAVPIHELRVPKQRRGGVVRIYFGYKTNDNNTIVFLAGELKMNWRSSPNPAIIKNAIKRYREECV